MSRPDSNGRADTRIEARSFFLAFLIHFLAVAKLTARYGANAFYSQNEKARIAWSLASGHGIYGVPWSLALALFSIVYYVSHPLPVYGHPIELILLLAASYGIVSALRVLFPARAGMFATANG